MKSGVYTNYDDSPLGLVLQLTRLHLLISAISIHNHQIFCGGWKSVETEPLDVCVNLQTLVGTAERSLARNVSYHLEKVELEPRTVVQNTTE